MNQRLRWLSHKSQLLNQNIAHADIPGYNRKDIKPFESLVDLRKKSLSVSTPFNKTAYLDTQEPVAREWEIVALTEVASDYQAVIALYRKYMGLIKSVIGKPSS
ncbi:MAG: hypothetical protein HYS39_01385 [Proteobacteria bacterium]|nr:hypothetical protein [Pseudomonadota bacterium]